MAKTRQQKEKALKDFTESLKIAKSLVFANFDGLTVKEAEELRTECREAQVGVSVMKKNLMRIAFEEVGLDVDVKGMDKGVVTLIGFGDEVAPARIAAKFAKDHEALITLGGVLEGSYVDEAKVAELSKLPSREELLAKVVGSVAAPMSGLVGVTSGVLRSLVFALKAVGEKKAE